MRLVHRTLYASLACALTLGAPAAAQQQGARGGLMADLLQDISLVEQKLVGLARAIPADKWSWRPGEGVRSVGEVFLHVAADNYFLPSALGAAIPAATGIKAGDYQSVQAFEGRAMPKEATVAELERSFAHLKTALQGASLMGDDISMFGQSFSRRSYLILTTTHLHEHLGQMIAYARTNGVVPPWSRGGM